MTSAEKLREDLISISWAPERLAPERPPVYHQFPQFIPQPSTRENSITVQVTNLPDVFEFCQLNYHSDNREIFLEVSFVLSKTLKRPPSAEKISILASKDGIKLVPLKYHTIYGTKTKWITSWQITAGRAGCHNCGVRTSFDIVIDLALNSAVSVTKGAQHVLDHILNLWKTKTLADVTFRFRELDRQIKAHTMIVASGSPVLAAMFSNDFKESREKIVDIKDITSGTFSRLLRFMYIGDASLDSHVSEEEITQLLVAANKYAVETLKEDCALHLSRNLTVENASHFLVLAHIHNSSILLESTFDFISKNAKAVCSRSDWMAVIKNYPELCFQATQLMFGL